jgi:hypothetical protein
MKNVETNELTVLVRNGETLLIRRPTFGKKMRGMTTKKGLRRGPGSTVF